jgi:hypothetical protein
VAVRVGEYVQGLVWVIEPVVDDTSTESEGTLVLRGQLLSGSDAQVEMELLRNGVARPCRRRERVDLLEAEPGAAVGVAEDEPVVAVGIGRTGWRRFVARSVRVTEQLSVELRGPAGVEGVDDDRSQLRADARRIVVSGCRPARRAA